MPDGPIQSFLRDISTGIDGKSFDVGRVGLMVSVFFYFVIGFMEELHASPDYPFEYDKFGYGLAAIVAAWAALLKAKEKTEPPVGTPPGG